MKLGYMIWLFEVLVGTSLVIFEKFVAFRVVFVASRVVFEKCMAFRVVFEKFVAFRVVFWVLELQTCCGLC